MATLVLGLAGQAAGNALLPAGITLFGQTITGADSPRAMLIRFGMLTPNPTDQSAPRLR